VVEFDLEDLAGLEDEDFDQDSEREWTGPVARSGAAVGEGGGTGVRVVREPPEQLVVPRESYRESGRQGSAEEASEEESVSLVERVGQREFWMQPRVSSAVRAYLVVSMVAYGGICQMAIYSYVVTSSYENWVRTLTLHPDPLHCGCPAPLSPHL
jgi:hypothetical protein